MQPDKDTGAILIVDDHDAVRNLVGTLLASSGYTVILAADGMEALARFKQHQKAIKLLLTDVMMPNMNGLELAEHVSALDEGLPILFMSGTHCDADRGYGCVSKPFTDEDLLAKVGAVLRRCS